MDHDTRPQGTLTFQPAGVWLLTRMKARATWNHIRGVVEEAPVKVFAAGVFVSVIWLALYELFLVVFRSFQADLLQSAIAIPLLFNFFFAALLVLLTFSNAILMYTTMFMHEESEYLLSAPLKPLSTVTLKYLEGLFFSSWSLFLLGLPLMKAIADVQNEAWVFYPLFIAYFLAFVPIPGAMGLMLAWGFARYLPRTARRWLAYVGGALFLASAIWGLRSVRQLDWISDDWIHGFFDRLSLIESAILPSSWVSRGIEWALRDDRATAVKYLLLTLANALFLSWAAIHIVARRFQSAYDRASASRGSAVRQAATAGGGIVGAVFFFLPRQARLIAVKDFRTFVRDPMQWSQLAILFGLMALYLLNTPRFTIDTDTGRWKTLIPFLNLAAISFILATFTSRFVFPMVSLEGRQIWLIGLLPFPRWWILAAKFSFAFLVTAVSASSVMLLASYILRVGTTATLINMVVMISVCFGLCGLSIGLGARMPMFEQRSPARIANGLGGTINLIASVFMISLMLTGMGLVTFRFGGHHTAMGSSTAIWILVGVAGIGVGSGVGAMIVGARHFKRLEV